MRSPRPYILWYWHSWRIYLLPVSRRLRKNGRNSRAESWGLAKEAALMMLRRRGVIENKVVSTDPQVKRLLDQ